jgi:hypothetical protein
MGAGIDCGEASCVGAPGEHIPGVHVFFWETPGFHVWKTIKGVELQGWRNNWRWKVKILCNIARCTKCPPDVRRYFLCEIKERKKSINEERLDRVESTVPIANDKDEELQDVLEVSRREAEFQRRVGERYEHGGESRGGGGSASGGRGIRGFLRRATSQRERLSDFDAVRDKAPVQTKIDTDPFSWCIVDYFHVLWTIFMYYGWISCIVFKCDVQIQ